MFNNKLPFSRSFIVKIASLKIRAIEWNSERKRNFKENTAILIKFVIKTSDKALL